MIDVYVVLERKGDGYHIYHPELLAVYFEERLAEAHARSNEAYVVEAVPLAPQHLYLPKREGSGGREDG